MKIEPQIKKINIVDDVTGPTVYIAESAANTRKNQASLLQKGSYTIGAAGTAAITFDQPYSTTTGLVVALGPAGANTQHITNLTATGFTANGTNTETGYYIALGYK